MSNPRTIQNNHYVRALTTLVLVAAISTLLLSMSVVQPASANGGTIVVTSTGDEKDADLGDGRCDTVGNGSLNCTLRAAIEEANQRSGPDFIAFNIAGSGVHTIEPASSLPAISGQVTIDGYSQPGASENTQLDTDNAVIEIELDGSNAGSPANGLNVNFLSDDTLIRGLAINSFSNHGINIDSANDVHVEGNFIGTNASGNSAKPNTNDGVRIISINDSATGNTIGGTRPDQRNIIGGNFGAGVEIRDPLPSNSENANANVVEGNFIGTTAKLFNAVPVANGNSGVLLCASSNNFIGNTTPGAANTIAFNSTDGVNVLEDGGKATSNRIVTNSIFSNGSLGLDLGGDGITTNDQGDADTGANNLQNFPVLSSARFKSGKTIVSGKLNSVPLKDYRIEFFVNPEADSTGSGEGIFLGAKSVTTNANGNASFSFTSPEAIPPGNFVTATAAQTFTSGGFVIPTDTSEFSTPVKVKEGTPPRVESVSPAPNATGVASGVNVSAVFSEAMNASTINSATVTLKKVDATKKVAATVAYSQAKRKATLNPQASLKPGATFTATVGTGAKDRAGNSLDQNPTTAGKQPMVWKFTVKN